MGIREASTIELDWPVKGYRVTRTAHAVPGAAGFLMSKPDLKALGAAINLETDSMYLKRLDMTMPLNETAAGNYEIDFLNREKGVQRQTRASEARVQSVAGRGAAPTFQQGQVGARRPGGRRGSCSPRHESRPWRRGRGSGKVSVWTRRQAGM